MIGRNGKMLFTRYLNIGLGGSTPEEYAEYVGFRKTATQDERIAMEVMMNRRSTWRFNVGLMSKGLFDKQTYLDGRRPIEKGYSQG